MRVLSLIPDGDNCGWGVCGKNLAVELPKVCEVVGLGQEYDAVLAPVTNHNWGYPPEHEDLCEAARKAGKPVVGYGFHEFRGMGADNIHRLVANYDALACGSSWMKDWVDVALADIKATLPTSVVFQGVDRNIFKPKDIPRPDFMNDRYVVALTGKLEFRKGQDVVIEAFRRFLKSVPSAIITMAIDNPWLASMNSMAQSKWLKLEDVMLINHGGAVFIQGIHPSVIPFENQSMWRMGSNAEMADFYNCADLTVFANRCEAGQTLGALENAACETPMIIPDWTGMGDLADALSGCKSVSVLTRGKEIRDPGPSYGFYEPCVDEVLSAMMTQYKRRTELGVVRSWSDRQEIGYRMSHDFHWNWTAKDLVELIERVV